MGSTSRSTWKRRERQAARLFGAERQRCSGSSGRPDCSRSDSTHSHLFVETKMRAKSSVRTLWEKTFALAKKESKLPLLMIFDKGKRGGLCVFHEDHRAEIAAELLAARDEAAMEAKEGQHGDGAADAG